MSQDQQTHCGYVALVGRPNVGKSTLMNHVLRQKISITSRRPQTTRTNVLGIDTEDQFQAIYLDTPGIHNKTSKALNRYMVNSATTAARQVDVLVMVIEAGRWTEEDEAVFKLCQAQSGKCLAVLTKIDLLDNKEVLLPELARLGELNYFSEIVPVCALKQEGLDDVRQVVFKHLPEGPHFFSEDEVTDQTERRMVEEIIREKLMRQLGDEIPHNAAVVVEKFEDDKTITRIYADIYVERDSQKRIVIGKSGSRMKLIGIEARKDIELLLQRRVSLNLWVRVKKGWSNSPALMRRLGYD